MGLDSFKEDDESPSDDSDNDEQAEETTTAEPTETDNEEELSGLDAFVDNDTPTDDGEDNESSSTGDTERGSMFAETAGMSKKREIEYIRNNHIPDYHPEYQPESDWSYHSVIEVTCKCDQTFTFVTRGVCLNCGRTYEREGRIVNLINEPETEDGNVTN